MNCRAAATFDLPAPRPYFVHHAVNFAEPSPMGFALCTACGEHVNREQWAGRQCPGIPREATFAPVSPGEVACWKCHAAVAVYPEHRGMVRMFGATCELCFTTKEKAA